MPKKPCFLVQRKGEEEWKFEREETGLDSLEQGWTKGLDNLGLEEVGGSFWRRRGVGLEPLALWAGPWAVG